MKKVIFLMFLALSTGTCFGQSAKQIDSILVKILSDFRKSPNYQLINDSNTNYDYDKLGYEKILFSSKEKETTVLYYDSGLNYTGI